MNELEILILIIVAVVARILLKQQTTFILPKISKDKKGNTKFELNTLGVILIGIITAFGLYQSTPEAFISPIAAFMVVYGGSSFIDNAITYVIPNEEKINYEG